MKLLLIAALCSMLFGCAEGILRVRVKNCSYVGAGLYDCEEVPPSPTEPRK